MNSEKIISNTEEPVKVPELVQITKAELATKLTELPLHTPVQITDDGARFMIVMEDIHNTRYWGLYDGTNYKYALQLNEWYKRGQQMFADGKQLSPEDLNILRQVIMSITLLVDFMEWSEKTATTMIDEAIVRVAFRVYKKDFPEFNGVINDLANNGDFSARINLVTIYATEFVKMMNELQDKVNEKHNDIVRNSPETEPNKQ